MRVCVTGGTGFVGGALVRRLLAEGAHVRVLARPSSRADELEAKGVEVVRGHMGDVAAIERAIEGAEVVFHLAAKVEGSSTSEQFIETNVEGTQRLLDACKRLGRTQLVYLSSIAVYGLVKNNERITELTPWGDAPEMRDPYSRSKILADELVQKSGIPAKILRPGVVYGPGRPMPVGLLGFRLGKLNFVFGNRQNRIPLNFVENLVDAMLLAAQHKADRLRQYLILDDDGLTLKEYHQTRAQIENTRVIFVPGWPLLAGAAIPDILGRIFSPGSRRHSVRRLQIKRALQNRWYDTRKIHEECGWAPKVSLREAIERTVRHQS